MTDQLTDRSRKAAEEILNMTDECPAAHYGEKCEGCDGPKCTPSIDEITAIIERHWREWEEEKNKNIERIRRFNESEILRFVEDHKEDEPCPEK